jgi:hypothetical protein
MSGVRGLTYEASRRAKSLIRIGLSKGEGRGDGVKYSEHVGELVDATYLSNTADYFDGL